METRYIFKNGGSLTNEEVNKIVKEIIDLFAENQMSYAQAMFIVDVLPEHLGSYVVLNVSSH